MSSQNFTGVWTAVVTPFKGEQQHIDWDAFEAILKAQADAGVQGIVVSGTTGESPTLSVQEKLSLFRKARAVLPKSVRVMGGTGGNHTEQSVELSRLAQDAGCDSLLIVTPPYNKPSLAGLKAHFAAIQQAVSIPLCLYHVPGRTGQTLTPEAIAEICQNPQVLAVKEASANLELFSKARMLSQRAFLSGDDMTYLPSLAVGGSGVISVVSNFFPAAMVAMTNAFQKGDHTKALAIHEALLPFMIGMFCETNPTPIKAAMAYRGDLKNQLRLPLVPVMDNNEKKVREWVDTTQTKLKSLGVSIR